MNKLSTHETAKKRTSIYLKNNKASNIPTINPLATKSKEKQFKLLIASQFRNKNTQKENKLKNIDNHYILREQLLPK